MTTVDDNDATRLSALEAEVARLTALLQTLSPRRESPAPPATTALTRRHLLLGGGIAAAAAGLTAPHPAGAQSSDAAGISFTPAGRLAATNVQAALVELDVEKQPATTLDARLTGAVGDGQTDNTDAFQRAFDVVAGFGGGTVTLPTGTFLFSERIVVPAGVDVWGGGGHQQGGSNTGTTLKASGPNAQVVIRGVGGLSGNFGIDGDRITNPDGSSRKGLLLLEETVVRQFSALRVSRSATDGVVMLGAQNCLFTQCMFSDCARHGLVLDSHALSSAFVRCDISNCGGDNLLIRTSPNDDRAPNYNTFLRCAFERGLWQGGGWNGPNNSLAHVTSHGDFNCFIHCGFTLPNETRSQSGALVLISNGRTTFDSCDWTTQRPGIRAVRVTAPGTATFVGRNLLETPVGIEWNRDTEGNEPSPENVMGQIAFGASTVPWTGTARPHETASFRVGRPHEVVLDPRDYLDPADDVRKGSSYGLRLRRDGENGIRYQVSHDGEIQVSDGTTWAPKARWRLNSTGGWRTPDPVHFDAGLHVNGGWVTMQEAANPNSGAIPASGRAAMYVRADKLVIAFNDGGTLRFKWLPLAGPGAAWVDSTTAP
jgi:hypothetical protein